MKRDVFLAGVHKNPIAFSGNDLPKFWRKACGIYAPRAQGGHSLRNPTHLKKNNIVPSRNKPEIIERHVSRQGG